MEPGSCIKDTKIKLKTYNQSTIMQLSICNFGIPDIKLLNILTIRCNIIDTKEKIKTQIAAQTDVIPIM